METTPGPNFGEMGGWEFAALPQVNSSAGTFNGLALQMNEAHTRVLNDEGKSWNDLIRPTIWNVVRVRSLHRSFLMMSPVASRQVWEAVQ